LYQSPKILESYHVDEVLGVAETSSYGAVPAAHGAAGGNNDWMYAVAAGGVGVGLTQ